MRIFGLPAPPRADLTASLVVFLVALPLCVGVAVASGVPAELGLVTGIVGGLVVGVLPGSTLQVSGPTAGLAVLVAEAVGTYGLPALGTIVLATGLVQAALGVARLGRWFRATSVAVVEGTLTGIGLIIIAGQAYAMAGLTAPTSGWDKIRGLAVLPARIAASPTAPATFAVGAGTLLLLLAWRHLPSRIRSVPGPLAAVAAATLATRIGDLPVARIEIRGLLDAVQPLGSGSIAVLGTTGFAGTVVAFTLIASAESLFSAAAVDRLHNGPRTDYDRELIAQGAGNAVCGLLGALPMAAVIVRSAANVQAGARTRASRVMHGAWLLLFAALLPAVLAQLPVAALAAVLVHSGGKLMPVGFLPGLWREHRGEAVILMSTAGTVVLFSLFEGVLAGLLLAITKTAWQSSMLSVVTHDTGSGPVRVRVAGTATFLRLPVLLDALEAVPADRPVLLDLTASRLDHACRSAVTGWLEQHGNRCEQPPGTPSPA
ncbi:SulP family inorganic anion transporter [Actinoplanes rectilineatus]|uniref:SulP family inorganic anion transporter n=1 Tax=Actinoplanes rectilineatus TaxID=113571 RepID=UPI0005F288BD|nr:SulP family inorganic anion transporter [Actinoplanes rectilineatus]